MTLSVTEYNRLIDLAGRPPQASTAAPVAAVLSSADLRVRVDRDTARGAFSVIGDVLRPGVARVNLLAGATLVDATAGGRPLPLVAEGDAHTALLPGPGPFALTLEWGAPLTFTPGRASFALPAPPAGTVRATIDLPGEQADVHLSSGLVTRRTAAGGRTVVEATLTPGSATEVWWSMRDSAPTAAAREARTVADVMTLVTLGDSDVRMVALIDVTVVQGEPRTIDIQLPAGYELTSIAGGSLEKSDQNGGTVTLTVGEPAARRHQFLVSLERPHAGGSFTLDTGFVSVADVQRERGEVAVEGVGTLELTARGPRRHAPDRRPRAAAGAAVAGPAAAAVGVPVSAHRGDGAGADARGEAIRRCRRARGVRGAGDGDDAHHGRRAGADRGRAHPAESGAAVSQGHAAGGRVDRVGRGGGRGRQTGARRRRRPRAASAPGFPARTGRTRCRSSTCTPARRSRARAICR